MKKTVSALLTLSLLCACCLLSACGLLDAFSNRVPTTYASAEKYTAGNTEFEGKVDTFGIWWQDGSVTVKTHKENTVKIEESANQTLDDTFRLHWRYYNTTDYGNVLYIQYSASGNFDFGELKKDITVYLPENDGMDLSLQTDAASADLDVSGFENTLEELHVITNSGKISAKIDSADEAWIAGQNDEGVPEEMREFIFRASGTVYTLGISTSYAKVDAAVRSLRNGEVGSVFGDLIFSADEARDLTLHNSANKISATVLDFKDIDIETRDGACELMLSPDAAFTLTLKEKDRFNHVATPKTVSIDYEGVTQNGLRYTVGTGEKTITVATSSDLHVLPQHTDS